MPSIDNDKYVAAPCLCCFLLFSSSSFFFFHLLFFSTRNVYTFFFFFPFRKPECLEIPDGNNYCREKKNDNNNNNYVFRTKTAATVSNTTRIENITRFPLKKQNGNAINIIFIDIQTHPNGILLLVVPRGIQFMCYSRGLSGKEQFLTTKKRKEKKKRNMCGLMLFRAK